MGSRDLMGNNFQKATVLSMLMKKQQFINILCNQWRIVVVQELHWVLLQTLLSKTCENVFQEPPAPAWPHLMGTHHLLGPHPHTWAASLTHQRGLLKRFLNIFQTLQVLLRQLFQVKLKKGTPTIWLDLTSNSLITQQALSLICHNHNFVTSQFAEKMCFNFVKLFHIKADLKPCFFTTLVLL